MTKNSEMRYSPLQIDEYSETQQQLSDLTIKLAKILIAKNKDYGNSFDKLFDEYGEPVIAIRIGDKYSRLKSLIKNEKREVSDESLVDTLMDLAGYAILSIRKLEENKHEIS